MVCVLCTHFFLCKVCSSMVANFGQLVCTVNLTAIIEL